MGYDILSRDLFEEVDGKGKDKKKHFSKDPDKNPRDMIPFMIHLTLILVVLIVIGYIILTFFSSDDEKINELQILGGIDSLTHNYSGDLILDATRFEIQSPNGKFNDVNKEIFIANFSGYVSMQNESIIVDGISDRITYGENTINLNSGRFKLTSQSKVEFNMYFDNLSLQMLDAEIMFSDRLKYSFDSAYIEIFGFDSTIVYDGTFSITGVPTQFSMISETDNIFISYS